MRTVLRHGLLILGVALAAPALGQSSSRRANLGPIVPCQATVQVVEPGLMPRPPSLPPVHDPGQAPPGARASFGAPRPVEDIRQPSEQPVHDAGVRRSSAQDPESTYLYHTTGSIPVGVACANSPSSRISLSRCRKMKPSCLARSRLVM